MQVLEFVGSDVYKSCAGKILQGSTSDKNRIESDMRCHKTQKHDWRKTCSVFAPN